MGSETFDPLVLIRPDWPAPASVGALVTTRRGGLSTAPYDSLNLGLNTGDEPASVACNRDLLLHGVSGPDHIQWLQQVHGTKVVDANRSGLAQTADGAFSRLPGLACGVLTADCLPLLLCNTSGTEVAAVHAGWRGLASGIVASAIRKFQAPSSQLMAWMGPAISQNAFEVGLDVLEQFYASARDADHLAAVSAAFQPSNRTPFKYYADLYGLARAELRTLGVSAVYGGDFCTVGDEQRFYSYRRDGETGRMASLVWLSQIK